MVKILGYRNFWIHPENTIENFFIPLFESALGEEVRLRTNGSEEIDIELISVFKSREAVLIRILRKLKLGFLVQIISKSMSVTPKEVKRVWFTGENKRPPLTEDYDAYLGFEKSGLNSRTIYLPLWVLNLDSFGKSSLNHRISKTSNQESLMRGRSIKAQELTSRKFCCIFLNNPEPIRLEMINRLREIGEVDIFGSFTNNIVEDKIEVGQQYRFVICFENTLYPGYVTEKLLEAYETTALPLYWGLDRDGYFNTNSFLNFNDYKTFDEFVLHVGYLNSDFESLVAKINEPLLTREFCVQDLILELRKMLVN